MKTHQHIDARGLALASRIVELIDSDPVRRGLEHARETCRRWQRIIPGGQRQSVDEWAQILERPWEQIREILLDSGEEGCRLRQNSPFCSVLSNAERWRIMREFRTNEPAAT